MKSTLRRLSAVAGVATAVAVVGSLLVAPSASAAITGITPNTAENVANKSVTFSFDGSGGNYTLGGNASFVRLNAPSDSFTVGTLTATMDAAGAQGRSASGNVPLADAGSGLFADGPANSGTYNVTANDRAPMTDADTCTSCFTVLPAAPLTLTALSPNSQLAGQTSNRLVTFTGDGFERGSRIDFLLAGTQTVDSAINGNLEPPDDGDPTTDGDTTDGITTRTTLRRTVTVSNAAPTGARDVRITNVDGSTTVLPGGFAVNGAPLTSTTPNGGNNDPSRAPLTVTFNGGGLNTAGKPFLQFVNDPGSSTREALTIAGTVVGTPTTSSITATFDLRNAAPAAYLPVVRNPNGSSNACSCSFTVLQSSTRVTTVSGLDSDTATAGTDKAQAAGTTKSFVVTGTNFAKGTRVAVSGTGVTTTAVEFLSPTQLRATFQSTAAAATGDRNVTATRTDGSTSAACANCYTVTAAASPSPSASASRTPSPSASASASASSNPLVQAPTINVNPQTIIAVQEKATVFGQATPGSTIEIYAYSRPNTEYARVRTGTVGPDGTYSFEVGPSGNTRLYAQTVTPQGSAKSDSIILTVKTSLNLKIARTGTRTYRFTGSLLPKRPGQLVTVFYVNSSGGRTIAARARNAADGSYNVTRQFSGTGTFTFFTGTGTDNNNAANDSNRVRVTVR